MSPSMILSCHGSKPSWREVEDHVRLVEEAHHDPLAVRGGHGREADVDVLAGDLDADAAVLREPLLGDVEAAHDLDAARDRRLEPLRGADHLAQHAVDPVADRDVLLLRVDVDVARALLHRAEHERVHEPDDRRLVVGVEEVGRLLELVGDRLEVAGLEVLHQLLVLVRGAVVDRVDRVEHHASADATSGAIGAPRSIETESCAAVSSGSATATRTASPARPERQHPRLLREVDRDLRRELVRDAVRLDPVEERQVELERERAEHVLLRDDLEPHQDLAEPRPRLLAALERERLLEPLRRELRRLAEDLAERPAAQERGAVRDERGALAPLGRGERDDLGVGVVVHGRIRWNGRAARRSFLRRRSARRLAARARRAAPAARRRRRAAPAGGGRRRPGAAPAGGDRRRRRRPGGGTSGWHVEPVDRRPVLRRRGAGGP